MRIRERFILYAKGSDFPNKEKRKKHTKSQPTERKKSYSYKSKKKPMVIFFF
jgi:hypothetical protein